MDNTLNKSKIATVIASALAVLITLASAVLLIVKHLTPGTPAMDIMVVSSYSFQIAFLAVLFIQNRARINMSAHFGRFFGWMLMIMCVRIFTDQLSWTVDGNPDLAWLNWTTVTLTYMLGVPIMVFFWNYCSRVLGINPQKSSVINQIIIGMGGLVILLLLINPFTRIIFYIDADGYFVLAQTCWILLFQNVFCSIACIVAILVSKVRVNKKVTMSIVFIAPMAGIVIGIVVPGMIFMQYLLLTLAVFYCYVSVFIRSEDEFKARVRELDMATAIQRGALRADFGNFGDHKIYAYMKPAREVGGDFYDFFTVSEDTIGVLIADVSGKGIPAAMFMMQGLCAIRELAKSGCPINEVFENANNLLCAHNENEFFITAWMAYINRKTGEVHYVNAGHNPPIMKYADGSAEYIACKPGMVLAAMEGMTYRINEFVMNQGDTLFMYTDGIPEAQTEKAELYGEDRLIALARNAATDPEELTVTILNGVNSFVGRAEQFDDMTIISYEQE